MTIDKGKDKEKNFNDWLEAIEFVDGKGNILDLILEEDASSDPEQDRE